MTNKISDTNAQPKPIANSHPRIVDVVIGDLSVFPESIANLVADDLMQRAELGFNKYNTYLQPHNGRDSLADLYQELADACKYARVVIFEKNADADQMWRHYGSMLLMLVSIRKMILERDGK